VANLTVKIGGDARGFRKATREAKGHASKLGKALKGSLLGSVGRMGLAAGIGAAIGNAVMAGVRIAAAKFGELVGKLRGVEKGMAEVNTIARVSAKRLAELRHQVMQLGGEIGATAEELTGALYQALSAGVPENNVIDFLRVAGKGAVAGVSDIKTAVDGLSSVLNAYGMDVAEAARISDIFFEAVRLGKVTFSDIAMGIGKVAPLAASMGVTFEEVSAMLARLTAQGSSPEWRSHRFAALWPA